MITITDNTTSRTATVASHDVAETLTSWFEGAPSSVLEAIEELEAQVRRGEYTGDTEAYLNVTIS